MSDARDVILRPVVSEKSYALLDQGVYTFIVAPTPTRSRSARRSRRSSASGSSRSTPSTVRASASVTGRATFGKRPDTKRAIVTLAEGPIDLFES